ncbi:cytochrome P450 [Trametes maxima]|nr:cytochrome P450 [Trametes maxima]
MIFLATLLISTWLLWRVIRSTRTRSPLDKLPGPPSASILTGNITQLMDRLKGWDFHRKIAEDYGNVVKLHWLFGAPCLYVFDPAALHAILKDTTTYDEFDWWIESNRLILGPGIISAHGEMARKQRRLLMPAFATKHLRTFVPVFYRVTDKLVEALSSRVRDGSAELDVLSWMGRAALELAGQSVIGHSFDPLTEDVMDEFAEAIKRFAPEVTSPPIMLLRQATPVLKYLGPNSFRRWLAQHAPIRGVRTLTKVSDTLISRAEEIFKAKEAAILAGEQGGTNKDLLTILLEANMAASDEDKLPDEQLYGQMGAIVLAAMDTTASVLSRTLHLLAEHPDVQDKLRREVLDAKANIGEHLDFDQLQTTPVMPYLEAVCRESLRLYTPAPQTFRGATKDTVLPLSQPIRATDGTLLHELVVPRGTNIFIAMQASNRNKALWGEDAYEWKPERWLKPLPEAVEKAQIPGVFSPLMSFLGGARSCIGVTFAQVEMKIMLSELIANFAFEVSDIPVVWNFSGIVYPSISRESTKAELWAKMRRLRADELH